MSVPLLVRAGFMPLEIVQELRSTYDRKLAAGEIKPRQGLNYTDCGLSQVLSDARMPAMIEDIADRLRAFYPELPPLKLDYAAYTRLSAGGSHPLHADNCKLDGQPNHTSNRIASALVYLSECRKDFEGGGIYFPRAETTVAETLGLLVGFPSGLDYQHQVDKIIRGQRDALAIWYQAGEPGKDAVEVTVTPKAEPQKYTGAVLPARLGDDPYRWFTGGIERLTETMAELLPHVKPTRDHAVRLREIAMKLRAIADQASR